MKKILAIALTLIILHAESFAQTIKGNALLVHPTTGEIQPPSFITNFTSANGIFTTDGGALQGDLFLSNNSPSVKWEEGDASTNETIWEWASVNGSFRLRTRTQVDVLGSEVLQFTRSGTTPSLMTVTPAANLLSTLDTAGDITVTSGTPNLRLNESDAASNEKVWELAPIAGELRLRTRSDALVIGGTAIAFTRSGNTPAAITVTPYLRLSDDLELPQNGKIQWSGRSEIKSSADGYLTLYNDAETGFTGLRFGGTTASFPMIKRSSTAFNLRLADDSANADITTGGITASDVTITPGTLSSLFDGSGGFVLSANWSDHTDKVFDGSSYVSSALLYDGSSGYVMNSSNASVAAQLRDPGYPGNELVPKSSGQGWLFYGASTLYEGSSFTAVLNIENRSLYNSSEFEVLDWTTGVSFDNGNFTIDSTQNGTNGWIDTFNGGARFDGTLTTYNFTNTGTAAFGDFTIDTSGSGSSGWINTNTGDASFTGIVEADSFTMAGGRLTKVISKSTSTGNIGAGEDTLWTTSIGGGLLTDIGSCLNFRLSGTFATSVNNKRLRIKWGAVTVYDSGALAITTSSDWVATGQIMRTGAATQRCNVTINSSSTVLSASCDYTTASETLSSSSNFVVTGEATADNDITLEMGSTWVTPW